LSDALFDALIVADGYSHWLLVHGVSGLIYIVQVGGFAGTQMIFGPFTAEVGCADFPDRELIELGGTSGAIR